MIDSSTGRLSASEAVWLLTVFDVPDRYGGLMARLRFRPSKRKPNCWSRPFDPTRSGDRARAEIVLTVLRGSGVAGKWLPLPRQTNDVRRIIAAKGNRLPQDAAKHRNETQHQARQRERRASEDRARLSLIRANGGIED